VLTEETGIDELLINRLDYDGVWYGTEPVLYSSSDRSSFDSVWLGGQTRGFLDIRDTVRCVELAINPAEPGQFRVFNQFTEHFSIGDLAMMVKKAGGDGTNVEIDHW